MEILDAILRAIMETAYKIKMKNKILLFILGIFFLFQINFVLSSNASSTDYSVNSYATGISVSTINSDNFAGTSVILANPALSSALINICGDGICNSGEDCSSCPADCGVCSVLTTPQTTSSSSGGGGGISGIIQGFSTESFSLSLEQINVKIEQGKVTTQEITITNNKNSDLTIEVSTLKISDFLRIKEPQFTLKPKESKILKFEIIALKEDIPNLYLGKLNFKSGSDVKEILTSIEIQSANPLFDVGVEIPSQFLWIVPGKELYSKIELYNLGESGRAVDVNLEYRILDSNGNEILRTTEEVAVNTKMSFTKQFIIPSEAKLGKYVLYVRATYNNLVASSSVWFNVGKPTQIPFELSIILGAIILIGLIIGSIWNFRKLKKDKIPNKVSEYDLKGAGLIKKIK